MYEDTYKVSLAYEHLWIQATATTRPLTRCFACTLPTM